MPYSSKFFISLLLLTSTSVLAARAQHDWPVTDSAVWLYKLYDDFGMPVGYTSYYTSGDTMIGSQVYQKVYEGGYKCATRRDGARNVYAVPAGDTAEYWIYTFGMAAGDTLKGIWVLDFVDTGDTIQDTLVVTSVTTFPDLVGGSADVYELSSLSHGTYQWTEGIGSNYHVDFIVSFSFPFASNSLTVSGFQNFVCYKEGDTLIMGSDCIPLSSEDTHPGLVSAWPNPFRDVLHLSVAGNEPGVFRLYSIQGSLIFTSDLKPEMALPEIPSGIYIAEIHGMNHFCRYKIARE